ncbi:hypothetical protein ACFPYJ_12220 [Paenibacillus solisilvae]|uniref:LexA repressor DNA-binding domain-containing protein n=1 Tax=Paenibacillus solisilvae TaxID=2486751 RepID=A0ABW0VVG0_9BACL
MEVSIIRTIESFSRTHGFPPSIQDLLHETGADSILLIYRNLIKLKQRGFVEWDPNFPELLKVRKLRVREKRALDILRSFHATHQRMPIIEEILNMNHFRMPIDTILEDLARKAYIRWDPPFSETIVLLE